MTRAPMTREEVRRALIAAIAARPRENWVALELAESLARAEFARGAVYASRIARRRIDREQVSV